MKKNKEITLDQHYKNTAPLTMVELKRVLGKQPLQRTIIEDACCVNGVNWRDLTWEQVFMVNTAINLGAITAVRLERSKKVVDGNEAGLLQRLETSVNTWEKLNEFELLDLIKELKVIAPNDKRWEIKDCLLKHARKIYEVKFILSEIEPKK